MSSVSREILRRLGSARGASVRMLWRRSASLMRTTLRSSAIATIIFRMFSACCCWSVRSEIRPSFVTPSTSRATSGPNSRLTSSSVRFVSSTVSCRRAAAIVSASRPRSASIAALAAGVIYRAWRVSVPAAGAAVVFTILIAQFNPRQGDLLLQLAGLVLLGVGGAIGGNAYREFTETIQRQSKDLQQKHRAFLAATSDLDAGAHPGDMAVLTANIAGQVGADFACCYLVGADSRQFVPQPPGIGMEGLHPVALSRQPNGGGPLLAAIETGRTFAGEGNGTLKQLFSYLPDDFHVRGAMAVPMPVGDHIGGFI